MTDTYLGITSAKQATWRNSDVRPLFLSIIQRNPDATDAELIRLLFAEIKDDEDRLFSVTQYYGNLVLRSVRGARGGTEPRAAATAARIVEQAQQTKTELKARIERAVDQALLNRLMPNGKTLGECTGAECKAWGGWFTALAKKVPAKSTVASALSQIQVTNLWKANQK